uniref:Putative histone h1 n=1 Tax=Corethrella appendiculata TaxID=1370023 RepID=U5EIB1_9DIPT
MRQRSFSVYEPNEKDYAGKLSGKYQEGDEDDGSNSEDNAENEQIKTNLSDEDYMELFKRVKESLVYNDMMTWATRLKRVDFEKLKFNNYSAKTLEIAFKEKIEKCRKYRLLAEVIEEAERNYKKGAHIKIEKRAPSAYNLFFKDNYERLKQKGLKSTEIVKQIAAEYGSLSPKKKEIYKQKANDELDKIRKNIQNYVAEHPLMKDVFKGRKIKPKPVKIPKEKAQRKTHKSPLELYCEHKLSKKPDIDKQRLREKWDMLAKKDKIKYILKAFANFAEDDSKKLNVNKDELKLWEKHHNKPEIYSNVFLYYKSLNDKKFPNLSDKEKHDKIIQMWKLLPNEEKSKLKLDFKEYKNNFADHYKSYVERLPEYFHESEMKKFEDLMKNRKVDDSFNFVTPTKKPKWSKSKQPENDEPCSSNQVKKKNSISESEKTDSESKNSDVEEIRKSPVKAKSLFKQMSQLSDSTDSDHKRKKSKRPAEPVRTDSDNDASDKEDLIHIKITPNANNSESQPKKKKKKHSHEKEEMNSPKVQEIEYEIFSSPSSVPPKKRKLNITEVSPAVAKQPKKEKTTNEILLSPKAPPKPPANMFDYFVQNVYSGKPSRAKKAFENLSTEERQSLAAEHKKAKENYIDNLELYLQRKNGNRLSDYSPAKIQPKEQISDDSSSGSDSD